jgi:Transposase DDE domain group 1
MRYSNPEQLCFPPVAGQTLRADFEGGALSSDFGALLLRGIDRQIGLTERLAAAIHDKRHQSYIDHPLRDLLAQRIYQLASGYADANDANHLRHDPVFKLGVERCPLDPTHDLASAPTFSRLEHHIDHKDLYRLTRALVDHFIASYAEPPAAIVLDLDHSDDPTYGQQELAFSNHHSQNHCYLPLFIFEGTSHALVAAFLRPGTRPPGAENAMILVRLLSYLRRHWPYTHILVRGDSHCATPEVIEVIASYRWTDFVFGLAGHAVLLRQAAATLQEARRLHHQRIALAQAQGQAPPTRSRLYDEFVYAAGSWAQPWRVVLKAEVMQADDNPRFVVTSLEAPTPQMLYEDLYCARGNCENAIKAVKNDLHSDRTSATTFLANAMRLLLACAAYALHHALRTHTLQHTALAQAQPSTVILTLFKIATQVKQYKDRLLLHLPSACPVKALLQRVTTLLCAVPVPVGNTS